MGLGVQITQSSRTDEAVTSQGHAGVRVPGGGPGWPALNHDMTGVWPRDVTPVWLSELQVTRNPNPVDINGHSILLSYFAYIIL